MVVFFTRILPRPYQNSGISHKRACFFFTRILRRTYQNSGISHIRMCFFSTEFYNNHTKFHGFQFHIQEGVSLYQNFTETMPKFRDFTYKRVFLFHQNFTETIPKFMISHTGVCFFYTRILPRPYQNSGISHKRVCFFFTRILPRPYQNSGISHLKTGYQKQTTFDFGQVTTISGRFFANYINIFHKI